MSHYDQYSLEELEHMYAELVDMDKDMTFLEKGVLSNVKKTIVGGAKKAWDKSNEIIHKGVKAISSTTSNKTHKKIGDLHDKIKHEINTQKLDKYASVDKKNDHKIVVKFKKPEAFTSDRTIKIIWDDDKKMYVFKDTKNDQEYNVPENDAVSVIIRKLKKYQNRNS